MVLISERRPVNCPRCGRPMRVTDTRSDGHVRCRRYRCPLHGLVISGERLFDDQAKGRRIMQHLDKRRKRDDEP